ncbi:MAG: amphi-Trp domain-containing protein [Desulfovibrionales bacterium]
MSSENVLFKSEERMQRLEAAQFIREIAERVEQGEIILRRGEEELAVSLPESLVLEVKVEEEGGAKGWKRSFELELEWKEGESSGRVTLG